MSFALGQPVPLEALVYDSSGNLANATTVTLTVTLPDGTTETPTVTNPPSTTGTYDYDYTPANPGLHGVRWVFTDVNASAPPIDSFYVDPIAFPAICSLAEAREQCQVFDTTYDTLLMRYLRVASNTCEKKTQIWRRQTLTKTTDGGFRYVKLRNPVISITSVTETGVTITSSGYSLHASEGLLYRGTSSFPTRWATGWGNIVVTYVAGPSDGLIPEEIRQGVLLLTQHIWNTQRGRSGAPRSGEGADYSLPAGFFLPNAVREQWDPWIPELIG